MEDNKVKLSEYLEIALALDDGSITPEEADEKFNNFFSKLVVKSYMPHKDKVMCLGKVLFSLGEILDEVASAAYLEMLRTSCGLLSYCINLDNDVRPLGDIYGVYDAIHQYGLYDYIIKFCGDDYNLFSHMLSDMINISHIKKLTESAALFNEAEFDKWMTGMKELRTTLTPELVKGLVELNQQTDGASKKLLDTISEIAIEQSNDELNKTLDSMSEPNQDVE